MPSDNPFEPGMLDLEAHMRRIVEEFERGDDEAPAADAVSAMGGAAGDGPGAIERAVRPRSSPSIDWPSTSMVPASGVISPMMWRRSTLLPVPLRPITTTVLPVGTSRSTPASTCLQPSRLWSPRIAIMT